MRGVPNQPVTCKQCGGGEGCPKDQLCGPCRFRGRAGNRRFLWTEALDQMLRLGYQRAQRHGDKTVAIDNVTRASGFPRYVVKMRAIELGLTHDTRRPWTEQEREYLRTYAGAMTVKGIARHLHRSHEAVESMLERLKISRSIKCGYSVEDLVQLLGVSRKTVNVWIAREWLGRKGERVPENAARKFLRLHAEQYDLRRVDQEWFKGLIFPTFGTMGAQA